MTFRAVIYRNLISHNAFCHRLYFFLLVFLCYLVLLCHLAFFCLCQVVCVMEQRSRATFSKTFSLQTSLSFEWIYRTTGGFNSPPSRIKSAQMSGSWVDQRHQDKKELISFKKLKGKNVCSNYNNLESHVNHFIQPFRILSAQTMLHKISCELQPDLFEKYIANKKHSVPTIPSPARNWLSNSCVSLFKSQVSFHD